MINTVHEKKRSGLKLKKEKRYHNNLFVKVENVGAINFVTVSSKEGMRVLMKSLCDELQIPEAAFESVFEKKMDSEKIVCEKDEEGNGLKEYISQDFENLTPEERGNVTSEVNRRAGEEFANLHRKVLTQLDVNLFAEYMKCVGALVNNGELFGTVFRAGDVYLMTTFNVIQRIIDPCNTGQADYTLIEAENVFVNFNSSVLDIPDYKFRVRHVISTDTPLLDYTVLQIINNNDTLPKGLKLDKKPHNTETRPLYGIGYGNPETPFYKVLDNSCPIISSINTRILDCVKWLDETQDKNVPQVAGLNRSQYFKAHVQAMGFDPNIVDKGYQCIGREQHIFINAYMERGASGSPFLTSDGCVKGVLISGYPAFYFHLPKIVRSGFPRDKTFECILKLEYVHQHILERDPEIANKLFG
ncbi:uncharacterized protein LOC132752312 [Ruditapes philippinarum]|uniref:uncharacterized protein LOC132752312 n=1 Tax=Ruditapes philippinarum TaxID=129788 RepID=UPI00295B6E62|nr:uncharacterized protein LOC132752312 [Ruditapes philippinarum]